MSDLCGAGDGEWEVDPSGAFSMCLACGKSYHTEEEEEYAKFLKMACPWCIRAKGWVNEDCPCVCHVPGGGSIACLEDIDENRNP